METVLTALGDSASNGTSPAQPESLFDLVTLLALLVCLSASSIVILTYCASPRYRRHPNGIIFYRA